MGRNLTARVAACEDPTSLGLEQIMAMREEEQFKVMERLRRRVEGIVDDPQTAEALKPYYHFLCKRPCSSDEYLPTFNRPNVTLVDVAECKGVERLTEKGIVANGVEYEVDCVIFASGFEISTEISRRYAMDAIDGRDGLSLFDHWRDGYKTLHGMTSHGFPNQFHTGFIQGGVSANTTAMFEQQAEHIAYIIAEAVKRKAMTVEPSIEAQEAWGKHNQGRRDGHFGVRSLLHSRLLQQRGPRFRRRCPLVPRGLLHAGLLPIRRVARGMARQGRPRWPRARNIMPDLRFDDRVAVVTGGGRGLGRSYAMLLASQGAKVVVNDPGGSLTGDGTDVGPAEEVVREIVAAGGDAVANTDSVATPSGGQAIVDAALDRYGRIDILVHNAGNVRRASLKAMSYDDFEAVLDVHLRGAFHVVRQAFPLMCDAGYGRIVLTSSIGGLYGNHEVANYAIAKAGVIGLSNVAAMEGAAEGVKSNVIVPAAVTRMAEGIDTSAYPPMGPELVAPVVGWLAHETCSITGEILVALAGRVARAVVAETPGVYRPSWSMADVGENMAAIRDASDPVVFPVVPDGHGDHIRYSFGMATQGAVRG